MRPAAPRTSTPPPFPPLASLARRTPPPLGALRVPQRPAAAVHLPLPLLLRRRADRRCAKSAISTGTLARADAPRCECQQPLSVAARAHMHSPRPTTSPEHRQMRFPRAPAHYPAIPATEPTDFAHLLAPAPQPSAPEKAPPPTHRGELRQAACVCAAPTHFTNPPATDSRHLTLQSAPQHPQRSQMRMCLRQRRSPLLQKKQQAERIESFDGTPPVFAVPQSTPLTHPPPLPRLPAPQPAP